MVKKINRLFAVFLGGAPRRRAAAMMLMFGISGCGVAPQIIAPTRSVEVFLNPDTALGEKILIAGYLRYTFENRNLYPDKISSVNLREKSCLPVLIKRSDKDLLEVARGLDGAYVVIEGTIENVSPPGMVSFFTCKPVGIKVSAVHRRN